jgi:hypothetical protein
MGGSYRFPETIGNCYAISKQETPLARAYPQTIENRRQGRFFGLWWF